ncbi:hypothetical protein LLS47_12370 [Rouxiella badensis]|uniref:hypothetical protein n=1 Tax=Rouxiella badensis TaxID=1646377 RepID=UPI001D15469D|nr:hypothetical protein [Rouxiella badensis]MCC3733723.1 hypothetical protein [Rouxiella badensis]MCC3759624.1 hypothetical protein [Rouxiella badensis]
MNKLIPAISLMIVGCSSVPPNHPDPVYVEVKVPVQVLCDPGVISTPSFAVNTLPLGSPIDKQMQALRAERHQRIGYEKLLNAAIDSCRDTAR